MKKFKPLLFLLIFVFSCSSEYKQKKAIEKHFKKTMHDPSSYELVDYLFIEGPDYHYPNNKKFKDSIFNLYHIENSISKKDYEELSDSISDMEHRVNEFYLFDKALISIRGKNRFGSLVLKNHTLHFSNILDNIQIRAIDGVSVFDNITLQDINLDNN